MLPNFVVIGAMKAGTTSLYAYLRSHPQVFMAEPKELDFFVEEKNWRRGPSWYEQRFSGAGDAVAVGEASPNYTKYPAFDGVPERMSAMLPDARLVYVVRDPLERMRAHWIHDVAANGLRRPIGEALLANEHFRLCSSYALQLERFLEHYPQEQILVLRAEDLRSRRREQLRRVLSFIGADPGVELPDLDRELHRSADMRVPRRAFRGRHELRERIEHGTRGRVQAAVLRMTSRPLAPERATIPSDVVRRLRQLLRPDSARLRELLGHDFDCWDMLASDSGLAGQGAR